MRNFMLALAAAASLLAIAVPTYSQSGDECRELQHACEMTDQLDENRQRNCNRYRETCKVGQPSTLRLCQELRLACVQKDQLGERGQGNCRRYRETCR